MKEHEDHHFHNHGNNEANHPSHPGHPHSHPTHEHHTEMEHLPTAVATEVAPGLTYYDKPDQNGRKSFALTTPIAIIISGALIAFGMIGYGLVTQGGQASAAAIMFTGKSVDDTDYVEGKVKSNVILMEYADPECPFCVQVSPTIKKLRTDYADKIAFVYRHFPLTQIHPHSYDEARAIACAGKIGGTKKYYEYIDSIFGYQLERKSTQLPVTGTADIARSVGLDSAAFASCMTKGDTRATVDNSINDGIAAGVQGTPASFVLVKTRKGYEVVGSIDGARPYEYFKAMIDQALAK